LETADRHRRRALRPHHLPPGLLLFSALNVKRLTFNV
jgi:hypothetical protein